MFVFSALPEEWFFRGYLLTRLEVIKPGYQLQANIFSSIMFSLMHTITRGVPVGIEVFVPSLIFGLVYQKTNNIVLSVLVHAIFNLIYVAFLESNFNLIREVIGYSV